MEEIGDKVRFIGNGALADAENLLLSCHYRPEIQRIVKEAISGYLGGNPKFNGCFLDYHYFDNCSMDCE